MGMGEENNITAEVVQATRPDSIMEFLFGPVGQWVMLIMFVMLCGKSIVGFLKGFKKVKVGVGGVEMETKEDNSAACPHMLCKESRDKTVERIFACVDELREKVNHNAEGLKLVTETIKAHTTVIDNMHIYQLKDAFYSTSMPEAERMVAGLRYISEGHNHNFKEDVLRFCAENLDLYEGVTAALPDLALSDIDMLAVHGIDLQKERSNELGTRNISSYSK